MFTSLMNTCALPLASPTEPHPNSFDIHYGYYNYLNNPGILNGVSVIYWEVEATSDQGPSQTSPPPDIISCHSLPTRLHEPASYQISTRGHILPSQSTKPNNITSLPNLAETRDQKNNREGQVKWNNPEYHLSPRERGNINNLIRSFSKWEAAKKICRKIYEQIWSNLFRHILGALEFNDQTGIQFWISAIEKLGNFRKMSSYTDASSNSREKLPKSVSEMQYGEERLEAIQTHGSEKSGPRRRKCKVRSKISTIPNFTKQENLRNEWRTIGRTLRNVGDGFEIMNKKQLSWVRLRVAIGFDNVGTLLWSASLVALSASAKVFFARLK